MIEVLFVTFAALAGAIAGVLTSNWVASRWSCAICGHQSHWHIETDDRLGFRGCAHPGPCRCRGFI